MNRDDGPPLVAGIVLGSFLGLYVGVMVGVAMAGRDKKQKAKGRAHEHDVARIARQVLEAAGLDIDKIGKGARSDILNAVFDGYGKDRNEAAAIEAGREKIESLEVIGKLIGDDG